MKLFMAIYFIMHIALGVAGIIQVMDIPGLQPILALCCGFCTAAGLNGIIHFNWRK